MDKTKRKFSREFKTKAVRLMTARGAGAKSPFAATTPNTEAACLAQGPTNITRRFTGLPTLPEYCFLSMRKARATSPCHRGSFPNISNQKCCDDRLHLPEIRASSFSAFWLTTGSHAR